MKGYKPKLNCKKQLETSQNHTAQILELGMVQEETCNCENGICEKESQKNK